jgi:hypothetical protein
MIIETKRAKLLEFRSKAGLSRRQKLYFSRSIGLSTIKLHLPLKRSTIYSIFPQPSSLILFFIKINKLLSKFKKLFGSFAKKNKNI